MPQPEPEPEEGAEQAGALGSSGPGAEQEGSQQGTGHRLGMEAGRYRALAKLAVTAEPNGGRKRGHHKKGALVDVLRVDTARGSEGLRTVLEAPTPPGQDTPSTTSSIPVLLQESVSVAGYVVCQEFDEWAHSLP